MRMLITIKSRMLDIVTSLSKERNFSYLSNEELINYHKIGSHTINHYNLSKLSYDNQKIEIELAKKNLNQSLIGKLKYLLTPLEIDIIIMLILLKL